MNSGWRTVRLGEVLARNNEIAQLRDDCEYQEITVKLWGKGVVKRGTVPGEQLMGSRRFVARTGNFIMSRIDARNGALGIVPSDLDGALVTNDFPLFRVREDSLLPEYLGWLCRSADFVDRCRRASEGTTNRVRLQESAILETELTLPSTSEQRRVVARLEALKADIDTACALRHEASAQTEALFRAASQKAFLSCAADEVDLEEVCDDIIDNLHSNPIYSDSGVPCVRSPDVGWGTLNLASALRTDEAEYRRRTVRGEPGTDDVVFVREGGGTGKCALVEQGDRFSLGQRVMLLRPHLAKVRPMFLLYQLLSPLVQEVQITPLCKGSAAPHLNISQLRRFRFRLPTLDQQDRIVRALTAVRSQVAPLKKLQTETAAELDALSAALLHQAFSFGMKPAPAPSIARGGC